MNDHDCHLAGIIGRDPDAFASWVSVAEPRIRASLSSFATVVDTESVVQECLLRIWVAAASFKPDSQPNGLIRLGIRLARNLAVIEIRRRRPNTVEPDLIDTKSSSPDAIEPDPNMRQMVAECMGRLSSKPREAMEARLRAAGMPDRTCAGIAHMRLNTFLQNIRRARVGLAKCLERHGIHLGSRT